MKLRLPSLVCTSFLAGSLALNAAPAPQELLPADTMMMMTVPDWSGMMKASEVSAEVKLLKDPAMQPFLQKLVAKFKSDVLAPLEKDLEIDFSQYAALVQGQVTIAMLQNGWEGDNGKEPAFVLLIDSKDKSGDLTAALADLKSKWAAAGKPVKTTTVRGVEFTAVSVKESDISGVAKRAFGEGDADEGNADAGAAELYVAQSESLLLVGNDPKAFEKLLVRQAGGRVSSLGELPAYAMNHASMFRDAHMFGWVNAKRFMEIARAQLAAQGAPPAGMIPIPPPVQIFDALGFGGVETLAFNARQDSDGEVAGFLLGIPEFNRKGIFRFLVPDRKDSGPLPFIPENVASFSRMRLDGRKVWSGIEGLIKQLSPQLAMSMQGLMAFVGKDKDPNFDLKTGFIDNLGDDLINFTRNPQGSSLDEIIAPKSISLLSSPDAKQLANGFRMLASISPLGGAALTEREFLGRTVYTMELPGMPTPSGEMSKEGINFAASGAYVAVSDDVAMLEEYLRGNIGGDRPLRGKSGLNDAAQRVGGMSGGLFGYDNPTQTIKVIFEQLRKDPDAFENIASGGLTGMTGLELWDAGTRKDWLDFSLLPPFEAVEKYFGYTVYGMGTAADGIYFKTFSPNPPELR